MLRIILIVLILVQCSSNKSFTNESELIPLYIKKKIQQRVKQGKSPAIVVGVIDSLTSEIYCYGTKSFSTKDSVNQYSIFEIGSITKTFTALLLADYILNSEATLETPLQNLLPKNINSPTRNNDSIRLVHLLNHTSGLPNIPTNFSPKNPSNPFADYTNEELIEFINNYKLTKKIGETYEYSNTALALIGYLLALQENTNYEDLVLQKIALPLNLKQTKITLDAEMNSNLALGHHNGNRVENWDFLSFEGAGAIKSNLDDMMKYLKANMGLYKTDMYQAMQLSHTNTRDIKSEPLVGLGWHILKNENSEVTWHNGGTDGYRTYIGFDKSKNKGVVLLSNSTISVDDIGLHILDPTIPMAD